MPVLENLIEKDKVRKIENEKVYNCLTESEAAKFYSELFSDNFQGKEKPELYREVKAKHQEDGEAYRIMDSIVGQLKELLDPEAILIEIGGGVYQKRSGNAHEHFKHYYPLDISDSSIKRYSDKFGKVGIVADAKELPFKSNSIDCVLTHTFLEHPLDPEDVLKEIARVLKPGGIVVHNDAWFCRWWQRHGVVGLKRFSSMDSSEKLVWLGAKITEFPLLRIPPIVGRRFVREVFVGKNQELGLKYTKLNPNYDLHLGCDEDAANRIDPIDVVRFYESRNFQLVNTLTFQQRLFYPNKYIMLRKNG